MIESEKRAPQQSRNLTQRAICFLAAVSILCSGLIGCAQFPSLSRNSQLAIKAADQCGPQRAAFTRSGDFFAQELKTRVATGAAIGVGLGALVGGLSGGPQGLVRGALIGLATGLLGGLQSAYWEKLNQAGWDQATLSQTLNQDLHSEVEGMDHVAATFAQLRACRFAQAEKVKASAQRGLISSAEAQTRLAQQRTWFYEEAAAAQQTGLNMQKRDEQFAYAAQRLIQAPAAAVQPAVWQTFARIRRESKPAVTLVATQTLPQKRNSFEAAVEAAKTQSVAVFSLDAPATSL